MKASIILQFRRREILNAEMILHCTIVHNKERDTLTISFCDEHLSDVQRCLITRQIQEALSRFPKAHL